MPRRGPGVCAVCGTEAESAIASAAACGCNPGGGATAPRDPQDGDHRLRRSEADDSGRIPPEPEALRDVMSRYFAAMQPRARRPRRHRREVHRRRGDGGLRPARPPRGRRRAGRPRRGRHAGRRSPPERGFEAEHGITLNNHIGVNTGEVVAGDASLGQRLVTGDAVNVAARLEQAAGPGRSCWATSPPPGARCGDGRAGGAADPQGQGRAGPRLPPGRACGASSGRAAAQPTRRWSAARPRWPSCATSWPCAPWLAAAA